MKSEDQVRIGSYLMFSTVLALLTLFWFRSIVFILNIHIFYKQFHCKINNFSNVTSICPKYLCTQLICAKKKVVEKFSFNELKIEKVKFFTQSLTKIFCTNVFNAEGRLTSCLTFRTFLKLAP